MKLERSLHTSGSAALGLLLGLCLVGCDSESSTETAAEWSSTPTLTSSLKYITGAELKEHAAEIAAVCPSQSMEQDSACDFLVYHATLLETHVQAFQRFKTVDRYVSEFVVLHPSPSTQCLRRGFWGCLYNMLNASLADRLQAREACPADAADLDAQAERIRAELSLLDSACKKAAPAEGCGPDELAVQVQPRLCGSDWVLGTSCEREARADALARERRKWIDLGVADVDLPYLDPKTHEIVIPEEALEDAPTTAEDLSDHLRDVLQKHPRERLNAKQLAAIDRALESKQIDAEAERVFNSDPRKKRESHLAYVTRASVPYFAQVETRIEQLADPDPIPAPTPAAESNPTPKSVPKFVAPTLSPNEIAAIEAIPLPTAEQSEQRAFEYLVANRDAEMLPPGLGKVFVDYEITHELGTGDPEAYSLEDYHALLISYLGLVKELRAYAEHLRGTQALSDVSEIDAQVLRYINQRKTQTYEPTLRKTIHYLSRSKGNCVARTRLTWALMADLGMHPAVGLIAGTEGFSKHIQPVLIDADSLSSGYEMVIGSSGKQKGDYYQTQILVRALLPKNVRKVFPIQSFVIHKLRPDAPPPSQTAGEPGDEENFDQTPSTEPFDGSAEPGIHPFGGVDAIPNPSSALQNEISLRMQCLQETAQAYDDLRSGRPPKRPSIDACSPGWSASDGVTEVFISPGEVACRMDPSHPSYPAIKAALVQFYKSKTALFAAIEKDVTLLNLLPNDSSAFTMLLTQINKQRYGGNQLRRSSMNSCIADRAFLDVIEAFDTQWFRTRFVLETDTSISPERPARRKKRKEVGLPVTTDGDQDSGSAQVRIAYNTEGPMTKEGGSPVKKYLNLNALFTLCTVFDTHFDRCYTRELIDRALESRVEGVAHVVEAHTTSDRPDLRCKGYSHIPITEVDNWLRVYKHPAARLNRWLIRTILAVEATHSLDGYIAAQEGDRPCGP